MPMQPMGGMQLSPQQQDPGMMQPMHPRAVTRLSPNINDRLRDLPSAVCAATDQGPFITINTVRQPHDRVEHRRLIQFPGKERGASPSMSLPSEAERGLQITNKYDASDRARAEHRVQSVG
jgi:hypothetical protein